MNDTGALSNGPRFRRDPRARFHFHGRFASPVSPQRGGGLWFIPEGDPGSAVDHTFEAIRAGAEFCVTGRLPDTLADQPNPAQTVPRFQCMSSGTTGQPRRIRRSQASWIASFGINAGMFDLTDADRYGVLGQLGHSLTLYAVMEAAHLGADVHGVHGMRPDHALAALKAQGITVLYATPTQLRQLLAAGDGRTELSCLRLVLCGGGKLDAATRAGLAGLCPGAAVHEFYGASETSFITLSGPETPAGSVGRAYPGVEIHIRDPQGVATSETGEVWVKSPYLFTAYASGPAGDTRWRDGFLSVGEMGHLDPKGHLFLAGRKGRMVTIADQNVFPEEVEQTLLADPAVGQCVVLPRADDRRGHVLIAVVAGEGTEALRQHLLHSCRRALAPLKAPREVYFMPDFPLLASGKPDIQAITAHVDGGLP